MGYVFNNNYINENQAQEEIEKDLGFKIEPQSYIKFNAGRMEKMWTKNVLSTGLSSGFVEPLEATSIHMTVLLINHFIEQFFTNDMSFNQYAIDLYNNDITSIWNDIKDFIVLHYQTPRKDTDFWKYYFEKRDDYKKIIWDNYLSKGNKFTNLFPSSMWAQLGLYYNEFDYYRPRQTK